MATKRTREIQITGVKELKKMASQVAPKVARNLARSTVHYIAGVARKDMRRRVPEDEGTLKRAIVTKRRKMRNNMAISDVRITHGGQAKFDAWHRHFVEFGTKQHAAVPYIRPTVEQLAPQIPTLYRDEFGRRLERKLEQEAAKMGVK